MSTSAEKNLRWLELSAAVRAGELETLVPLFNKYGYGGAIVEEWPHDMGETTYVVKTYLPQNRSLNVKKAALSKEVKTSGLSVQLEENTLEPGEWRNEWKKYFEPFEMGEKVIIKPGWKTEPLKPNGRRVIELDPGMAFGTGLHATTRLTYLGLEKHLIPGMAVLDLGTGSGILAIAAAKLGAASVLAMDTDPVAVEAAATNAVKNNVENIVEAKKGTLNTTACRKLKGHFDLVTANITADVIAPLAPCFASVLKPRGRLITSGINERGLDSVLIALTIAGLKLESISSEGEWHAVIAIKPDKTEPFPVLQKKT